MRLTRAQVRSIDKAAVEKYGIPAIVLMENAARAVAQAALEMLGSDRNGVVMFLCGGGNNGGDGMAAARHLHNAGVSVEVMLTGGDPSKFVGEAMTNWQIVKAMNLQTGRGDPSYVSRQKPALIVDAIFGTGLTEPPRQPFQDVLVAIEKAGAPVLAVDIPSGLDCDRGFPVGVGCIKAKRTVTFVAEKIGFAAPTAKEYLGQVTVGDIGCPRELIEETLRGG